MPVKIDKDVRKALLEARSMTEAIAKVDANEAETRRRVERMFAALMGYDVFKHITREFSVHSVGDADYCDFAIVTDDVLTKTTKPSVLVEIKRVSMDLQTKHVKQAASYAIDIGCEWVLLTNCKEWQLFHITFGQPPQTHLIDSWNLMTDDFMVLADKFGIVGYKNVKKGGLGQLWQKSNVLVPRNVLKIILSEESISFIRREIKKATSVPITPEEVVGAVRHLLNEAAVAEMESIKICLPEKKIVKKAAQKAAPEETRATIQPPE